MDKQFDRRKFLKVSGISLGVGALTSVAPAIAGSGRRGRCGDLKISSTSRPIMSLKRRSHDKVGRFVAICDHFCGSGRCNMRMSSPSNELRTYAPGPDHFPPVLSLGGAISKSR